MDRGLRALVLALFACCAVATVLPAALEGLYKGAVEGDIGRVQAALEAGASADAAAEVRAAALTHPLETRRCCLLLRQAKREGVGRVLTLNARCARAGSPRCTWQRPWATWTLWSCC